MAPPDARGPLEVLVGAFSPIFRTFLGGILVVVEFYSRDYSFTCMLFFHKRVELFEEKSILVFPECLEASE